MKRSNLFIRLSGLSLGAICLALAIGTHAQAQSWVTKEDMPTARTGVATGVIAGKLYVVGGVLSSGDLTNVVEVYDPATNTWDTTTKAPMPTNRFYASAGVIGEKLYVVGGCISPDCGVDVTAILEVYDPVFDTWTTLPPMPTARATMATGVIAGKLYVAGGSESCGNCDGIGTLEVYNPADNTWDTTKASMPTARSQTDGAVINWKFYVVGGTTFGPPLNTLEVYNPSTGNWTTLAPMPTPRLGLGAGEVNGILYAVSGNNEFDESFNTVEAYNPATNTWALVFPIPTARYLPKPQSINGALYVAGSGAGDIAISTLEAFVPMVTTNQNPVCSVAQANPPALWSPNHKFVPIVVMGVTDPEGDAVTITVTSVTQDEPVNAEGDGNTSPDALIQAGSASVRAERSGTGDGRVYHLAFQADDGHGGTCTGDVTVGVPHSMGKGVIAIDSGQVYDSTIP